MTRLVFWTSLGALAWTHAGYALALALLRRLRGAAATPVRAPPRRTARPAARRDRRARRRRAAAARLPDRRRLQRGGGDRGQGRRRARARLAARPARAHRRGRRRRGAGRGHDRRARPRRGRRPRARASPRRQDPRPGRRGASGHAAISSPSPTRTRAGPPTRCARLTDAFADPAVGYACGQVSFVNEGGTNQEGLYWRYELWLRGHESALASVTAGNGAIYAVRPEAYIEVDPVMGHDLSLPFNLVKRGWRAVEVPAAGDGEDGAVDRGRVAAQAADDEPHAGRSSCAAGCSTRAATARCTRGMVFSHRVLRYAVAVPPRRARRGDARAAAGAVRCRRRRRSGRPRSWPVRSPRPGDPRARYSSRATTCSRRRRSRPGSMTGPATARPRGGTRRRAPAERGEHGRLGAAPREARQQRGRSRPRPRPRAGRCAGPPPRPASPPAARRSASSRGRRRE